MWIGCQVIFASALGWVNNKLGSPLRQCFLLSMYPSVSRSNSLASRWEEHLCISWTERPQHQLVSGLSGLPNLDSKVIVSLGATELRDYVGPEHLGEVLRVYNHVLMMSSWLLRFSRQFPLLGSIDRVEER